MSYLPKWVFAMLLIEHGSLALVCLAFFANNHPQDLATALIVGTVCAVPVFGLLSASISFARRQTSWLWSAIATGFGFVVACVVVFGAFEARSGMVQDAQERAALVEKYGGSCPPGWFECPGPDSYDGPIMIATVIAVVFLGLSVVLVASWITRSLRRGIRGDQRLGHP